VPPDHPAASRPPQERLRRRCASAARLLTLSRPPAARGRAGGGGVGEPHRDAEAGRAPARRPAGPGRWPPRPAYRLRDGHDAEFISYRAKTIDTAAGPVRLRRAWYHCAACRHGLAPRDAEPGTERSSLSPGLRKMIARAAATVPFAKAAGLLAELAGTGPTIMCTERSAEAGAAAARAISAEADAGERDKALAYFEHNAHRMRYQHFKSLEMFAGSGVVEAGCKPLGQRLKLSGMRWSLAGATGIARLRRPDAGHRWDEIWQRPRSQTAPADLVSLAS
jgi:hypothetical protein